MLSVQCCVAPAASPAGGARRHTFDTHSSFDTITGAFFWCRREAVPLDDGGGRFAPETTDRPVIGILCLELSPTVKKFYGDHDSYIAASYVKFVEGAGARVAPVLIGQPDEYYRNVVRSVNGLLLPGGATYFTEKNGYAAAGRRLYAEAIALNEAGVHFPVLGICLGMQLLAVAAAEEDLRSDCKSEDTVPLVFLPGAKRYSRLFARAQSAVIRTLEKENVTVNHHGRCVTREHMRRPGLSDWRPLTVNKDADGVEFVSALEHRRLPFYGVQFHPEKNSYEWKPTKNYPHWPSAIVASRYFADLLVWEARRNGNRFAPELERDRLIYRHQPTDTQRHLMWEQLYFISNSGCGTAEVRDTPGPGQNGEDFDV
ncbi:hypothetical protein ONE63_007996 [Megalurothrips usitatus]|uniref:folate gamma-glutamyl hydrolase n=1 Tax=Megalurothrips usitatus TaxID=439358 RepID=A0AAV7XPF6_9NEOP|nr:hypothetical protein ONE63_007996 [Megalurothrips usitatus]